MAPHGIGRFARELLSRLRGIEPLPSTLPVLHPLEAIWLSAALLRRRPDVYFSPGFNPPLRSPVPFVFTIHDLVHLHFHDEASWAKRLYYRRLVRPAASRAERVLTVSEFTKRELIKWAGVPDEHVVVVGNGVSAPFQPAGRRHEEARPYLLCVGLRRPHKNVARLLDAFALSGLQDDVRLVFGGPAHPWKADVGPADDWTLDLVTRRNLLGAVSFVGRLTDAELAAYYRGATALLLPSHYEGFGLPALEAMACGTPVLAARAGAIPEVAEDAALLVDPYATEAMAEGMRALVGDVELSEDLREKGLLRARLFSWESVAQRVQAVLDQVLAETARGRAA